MILYISTIGNSEIKVALKDGQVEIASINSEAKRVQAEKLLLCIEAILKKEKIKLAAIKSIEVENGGGSFTSLRIGVAVANALGFALGIPVAGTAGKADKVDGFDVVAPAYDREPDIGT